MSQTPKCAKTVLDFICLDILILDFMVLDIFILGILVMGNFTLCNAYFFNFKNFTHCQYTYVTYPFESGGNICVNILFEMYWNGWRKSLDCYESSIFKTAYFSTEELLFLTRVSLANTAIVPPSIWSRQID
jgi:hypothetical protein